MDPAPKMERPAMGRTQVVLTVRALLSNTTPIRTWLKRQATRPPFAELGIELEEGPL
jgi:hypothetical protein